MATRSVNKVILVGRITQDAETKFVGGNGTAVTRLSIATNRSWKDQSSGDWKEEVNYTNVVVWKQENLASYLLKGTQIYIEGRLQTRSWEDKETGKKSYATEVVAEEVILLGAKNGDSGENGGKPANGSKRAASPKQRPQPKEQDGGGWPEDVVIEDEVPF